MTCAVPGTGQARSLGHVRSLDGVRAVAFLVVFSVHLIPWPHIAGGEQAMDVFFALSGFLITALLVGERDGTSRISLPRFYARRGLRLLPALGLVLAVWLAVIALFGGENWVATIPGSSTGGTVPFSTAAEAVGVAFAYVFNWFAALNLFSAYIPLGHLWSLSVEEQFYLFWAPLLAVVCLPRLRRHALATTVTLAMVSLVEPLLLWHSGTGRIYFGTDTRAGVFLLGAAAALLWSRGSLTRLFDGARGGVVLSLATASLLLAGLWQYPPASETAWIGGWILASVAAPLVVAGVAERSTGSTARVLSVRPFVYIGQRSYGLYLWHYPWVTWLHDLGWVRVPLTIVATFACAEISWRLVEKPALALKKRLGPPGPPGPTGSGDPVRARPVAAIRMGEPVPVRR